MGVLGSSVGGAVLVAVGGTEVDVGFSDESHAAAIMTAKMIEDMRLMRMGLDTNLRVSNKHQDTYIKSGLRLENRNPLRCPSQRLSPRRRCPCYWVGSKFKVIMYQPFHGGYGATYGSSTPGQPDQ